MKQVFSKVKKSSRMTWLVLLAGTLLVAVLAATSAAALPGAGSAGLAISVQQGVTPVFSGIGPAAGPGVIVPVRPSPRSPFQPPSWLPGTPPWGPVFTPRT